MQMDVRLRWFALNNSEPLQSVSTMLGWVRLFPGVVTVANPSVCSCYGLNVFAELSNCKGVGYTSVTGCFTSLLSAAVFHVSEHLIAEDTVYFKFVQCCQCFGYVTQSVTNALLGPDTGIGWKCTKLGADRLPGDFLCSFGFSGTRRNGQSLRRAQRSALSL